MELGPGTGSITRALIESGISREHLILIERDRRMADWLTEHFPQVKVLHTNAGRLDKTLAEHSVGKVSTVVSGLPFCSLGDKKRDEIIAATFKSLKNGGRMIQFTYKPIFSPIPYKKYGLKGMRESFVLNNFPPAMVWSYTQQ